VQWLVRKQAGIFVIEFFAAVPKLSAMDNSQPSQLAQYIPILFLLAAAVGFAGGTLLVSILLGKYAKSNKAKDMPYECGKDPIGESGGRFSVKFYLVAMLFILFDIEVVFMYPWAVVYRDMLAEHATRNLILGSMISFLGILFAGYIYALKKKAFDWKT
jgi:NADH-quinone oxidoreductase subunit A